MSDLQTKAILHTHTHTHTHTHMHTHPHFEKYEVNHSLKHKTFTKLLNFIALSLSYCMYSKAAK